MAIWRGVGGSGESTNDSTVPTVTALLVDAEAARDAAQLAETNAETAASTASTQASNASTSATNAASSASSAASSATAAAASYDSFDDRYLGSKSTAPIVDNDGNTLIVGALYWDTTTNKMRVYTSSGWADLKDTISVKDFGAVGDGTTDDTAAIQAALNSSATDILFPAGNYRVVDSLLDGTPVLTSAVDNRRLHGAGIITATSQVKKLLLITGDNNTVSLNINGNLQIGYAIVVEAQNPTITQCTIWDLDGKTNFGGVAIRLDFDDLDTSAVVSNNIIRNLQGTGDGVNGNGVGMQRAISINSNQNCTKRILVSNNHISQVEGEEGDAIIVISSDGSGTYYTMPVVIQGNSIDLWTRRAVKVQASGVTITSNTFSNNRDSALGSLQRVIDIIQGGNIVIDSNKFKSCKYQVQVGAQLSSLEAANNFSVTNNTFEGLLTETSSTIISLNTYGSGVLIAGNSILCPSFTGTSISATNCTEVLVASNNINTNQTTWYSFTSSTNVRLAGNTIGNQLKPPYHFFYDLTANEYALDVSNGRSLTLRQADTVLSDNEIVARIRCRQNDASASESINASIGFVAEGSSGALGVAIYTGSQASSTAETERVRVTSSGVLRPAADNTQALGGTSNRWSVVYAGTGTINTSDERDKVDIEALSEAEKRVAATLKGLIKKFRFKDAVNAKGNKARIHVGVIAQEIVAAFAAEGLDANCYGMLCYDEWDEQTNEDGDVVIEAGNRYGIRYEELLSFIISGM